MAKVTVRLKVGAVNTLRLQMRTGMLSDLGKSSSREVVAMM
ncbi:hypothetical protein SBA5_650034 [Candidatus Sulfotelmatomonas gaucii]|uniref:Uncharacterized protein n=1 Tax=Candidatus Sulfuritelmatomonas gaucii TaxID=2043161 RepID=A0A2N9LYX8_9BACT|nr:hypothetical protein SBA5_650034 [Candidatus Sulfotelmatomonas gaucii]